MEKYALGNQIRRAAISVTNNIAEGHGRWHYQEHIRFCRISRGPIDELIDDLNTCLDEGYGDPVVVGELKVQAYDLIRRLNSYVAYLRTHHSPLTTHYSPPHHSPLTTFYSSVTNSSSGSSTASPR